MKKYGKFSVLVVVILGTLIWLGTSKIDEAQTYYKTITELDQMGQKAQGSRIRVGGDIAKGSIQRHSDMVEFTMVQEAKALKVVYDGKEPLPDTFRDGAQALADGKMGSDGVFHAQKIQAKCASKYAAKPGEVPGGLKPSVNPSRTSI